MKTFEYQLTDSAGSWREKIAAESRTEAEGKLKEIKKLAAQYYGLPIHDACLVQEVKGREFED